MQEFIHYTPTKVIFGKDTELQTGTEVKLAGGTKVLIVYGGGSVKKSGLLERVERVLEEEGIAYVEWGGVKPNPRLSHAEAGVKYALEEKIDFVLAVGGGSVIDTAKAIVFGMAHSEEDLWDVWMKKVPRVATLPVGVILTISAAGSETSGSAVLTNEETGKKSGCASGVNRPVFAIMNPELTYTLPKYQIACGVVDIMMHTLERYFIPNQKNQMTDEIAEGLLRTVVKNGRIAIQNPEDYDAMSEIMWCGSLSHNDLTGLGRGAKDFSVHKFGHALSAKFDAAHGASLSAVWGEWAKYIYKSDPERFQQYGRTVWGIQEEDSLKAAEETIKCTIDYFKELEMPISLSELGIGILSDDVLMELSMDATMNGTVKIAQIQKLGLEDVYQIFSNANH
ncbi:MAG: iron-containing alcohol dehydrogenase [Schaedlerella sp.]|nr:iron-containing alcohol dehydrogenase [Schaedlerella sp.]